MKYRSIFYSQYASTQATRDVSNLAQKFEQEKKQFAREILPLIPQKTNLRIIDIGCGNGSLLAALNQKGYQNTQGIDIAPDQVALAHSFGIKQVVQADLLQFLAQNPDTFDVVLGMDIIEHFTKDELVELLQNIRNTLKTDGFCLFRTPNADAVFSSIFIAGDFTHENQLNGYSARQVMANCNFRQVQVLAAHIQTVGFFRECLRMVAWFYIKTACKLIVFASGRSTKNVLFSPNLLIKAFK